MYEKELLVIFRRVATLSRQNRHAAVTARLRIGGRDATARRFPRAPAKTESGPKVFADQRLADQPVEMQRPSSPLLQPTVFSRNPAKILGKSSCAAVAMRRPAGKRDQLSPGAERDDRRHIDREYGWRNRPRQAARTPRFTVCRARLSECAAARAGE